MDKFPEAFKRSERVIDYSKFKNYREFVTGFRWWAGYPRWKGTAKQWQALNIEAGKRGFKVPEVYGYLKPTWQSHVTDSKNRSWREEIITVRGSSRVRYRDVKTGRFIKKP